MTTPTLAFGYRRVSTESQLDGFGLTLQDDAIAGVVAAEGYTLAGTFTDEGICGAEDMTTRHALADALDAIIANPGAVLIVPKLDRLARDLMIQEQVLADIWRNGGHVVSCMPAERVYCQPDDPMDPSRKLIRQILGAVAEYDRAMIRARLVGGRRRKIARDGYAGGPEPYGWSDLSERETLIIVAGDRQRGRTWKGISDGLNLTGRVKRNGERWTPADIHRTYQRAVQRGSITPVGTALTAPTLAL